jgi:HEAT repeat protein
MPREQLLGLAADVDRLVSAGANAAAGNDNLIRRSRTLRDLGQKVTALLPVADAIDRVTQAGPKQTGPALLDLVGVSRQVRASLVTSGLEGTLEPLPKSGPWQTPAPVRSLWALYETLTHKEMGREGALLEDKVDEKAVSDLRLLPALLAALDDKNAKVAQRAATDWLPRFGRAILPDLQSGLDLQGKRADARRLQTICRIDPSVGAGLCRKALQEGSVALRIQALECLPDVGKPGEAEKEGLSLAQDGNRDVRMAAMTALCRGTSNEALEALVAGLGDTDDKVQHTAQESLTELPHPGTTDRLLQELQTRLQALDEPAPAPKRGGKKTTASKASKKRPDSARQKRINDLTWVMTALAQRKDKKRAAAAQALLPLTNHPEKELRAHAIRALGWVGAATPEVVSTLTAALKDKSAQMVNYAVQALGKLPPEARETAVPALFELLKTFKKENELRQSILLLLPAHVDRFGKQVLATLQETLQSKERWLHWTASEALAQCGPAARSLLPEILQFIQSGQIFGHNCNRDFLARIDPEGTDALPGLMQMLGDRKAVIRGLALQLLASYGSKARAALPRIQELTEDKDFYVRHWAEHVLTQIG